MLTPEVEPTLYTDPDIQAQKDLYFKLGHVTGMLVATTLIHEEYIGELLEASLTATQENLALQTRITELEEVKKVLERTDSKFTSLLNLPTFEKEVRKRITGTKRHSDYSTKVHSLLFADIDDFKHVNQVLGNDDADEQCLAPVVDSIRMNIRSTDCAARHGGEEFAIYCEDLGMEGALALAQRIQHQTNTILVPEHGRLGITIGVVTFPHDSDYGIVIRAANSAEIEGKEIEGKNQILIRDLLPKNRDGISF